MPCFSPSNAHRTCPPIKIIELQVSEFAGPQPETLENDDGSVPEAYCRGAIQGIH